MKKVKKILKSPWTIAIASAFLAPIATMIVDAIMKKPLLSTLWIVVKALWNGIVSFLNFNIKVWWLLIGIGVIIGALVIIAKVVDVQEEKQPKFLSYKEDFFGAWKWSWRWEQNAYNKKWNVDNIRAHCPQCDTPMFSNDSESHFRCPRCDFSTYGSNHKKRYEIEALIIDNLERKDREGTNLD